MEPNEETQYLLDVVMPVLRSLADSVDDLAARLDIIDRRLTVLEIAA